jgi:hypothetical protein|nr:MAG TPA: hypothetical protein [Inoviridae sp.]
MELITELVKPDVFSAWFELFSFGNVGGLFLGFLAILIGSIFRAFLISVES